jgi:hypothetical protein
MGEALFFFCLFGKEFLPRAVATMEMAITERSGSASPVANFCADSIYIQTKRVSDVSGQGGGVETYDEEKGNTTHQTRKDNDTCSFHPCFSLKKENESVPCFALLPTYCWVFV